MITKKAPLYTTIVVIIFSTLLVCGVGLLYAESNKANTFEKRYVFFIGNMNDESRFNYLLQIMQRASNAGYNGIVLDNAGGQYTSLEKQPKTYFDRFSALKEKAAELKLALIPTHFAQNHPTYEDPTLAEAVPVLGTRYLVNVGIASVVQNDSIKLANADFEEFSNGEPLKWNLIDQPGRTISIDTTTKHSGKASMRIEDPGITNPPNGLARLNQTITLEPYRAYQVSVWVKTQNYSNPEQIKLYIEGLTDAAQPLYSNRTYAMGAPVLVTQDWTQYTVTFDSMKHSNVKIWIGAWSQNGHGKIWLDTMEIREVGLTNMSARESLKPVITTEDGNTTFQNITDYTVQAGQLYIPSGSKVRDGTVIKANWYLIADMFVKTPPASACQDKFFDILRDNAERLNSLFSPTLGFLMGYDEWRVGNWDPACGKITGGQYIAQAIRKSEDLLRSINESMVIYVWSDMVDPNHNATPVYYLINGNLENSWSGLSPSTVIMNWNHPHKKESLQFFFNQNHRQIIAGYYDSVDNVKDWLAVLDDLEKDGLKNVIGFMYTTWGQGNFNDLETVANTIRVAGRWSTSPAFPPAAPQNLRSTASK